MTARLLLRVPTRPVGPPIGWLSGGRPVYGVRGGAEDGGGGAGGTGAGGEGAGGSAGESGSAGGAGEAGSGAAGSEGEKTYSQRYVEQLRRENQNLRTGKTAAETKVGELEGQSKTELERAVEAARKQSRDETLTGAKKVVVRATVRALAARDWADPSDAHRFVDLDGFDVSDDGTVDETKVGEALTKVLTDKPYLRVPTEGRPPRGSADSGPRGGRDSKPATLEEAYAASMKPTR